MRAIAVTGATLLLVGSAGWCLWSGHRSPATAHVVAPAVTVAAPPAVASGWLQDGPCEIQPLRASHRGCGLDPRLAGLAPLFHRAPWTAYSCFEPTAAPAPVPAVELRPVHGRDGRRRIRLREGGTAYTVAQRPTETALIATHAAAGELAVLALRCR